MERVILHSDLNSFYASVECLYRPEIKKKPVAICGSQDSRHGVVLAKNIHAKKMGVKTGEAIWESKIKCPNIITLFPDYKKYFRFSKEVRKIYGRYTSLIESFGIDECWLDVTQSVKLFGSGEKIAHHIANQIEYELGITASIGVSFNKIFAKLGSDIGEANDVIVISKENYKEIIWSLPVEELLFVGRSTRRKFSNVGIITIGDLANTSIYFLKSLLGKWGETLWSFANGYDVSPVVELDYERDIKSIGNSITTIRDLVNNDDVKTVIYILSESVGERLRELNMKGRTVQINIRDVDLISIERQATFSEITFLTSEIAKKAMEIFLSSWNWNKNIRSMGVRVSNLYIADTFKQISFFDDDKREKLEKLDRVIDQIRSRYGYYSVNRAIIANQKEFAMNPAKTNIGMPIFFK